MEKILLPTDYDSQTLLNNCQTLYSNDSAILEKLFKKLEGKNCVFIERQCFLPLIVCRGWVLSKDITQYQVGLQCIQNSDLMRVPEFTLYEVTKEDEKKYIPYGYINHNFQSNMISLDLDLRDFYINREKQARICGDFAKFLRGLKRDGYLGFGVVSSWKETHHFQEYYGITKGV